jgi:NlpC/P60 family putative phage cell wall peptidase
MALPRGEIVAEARDWIGTPFAHHQATKGAGCDCIGLVAGVASAAGITNAWFDGRAAPFKGYGKTPDPGVLRRACETFMERIPVASVLPGDVLVMRVPRGQEPQHFGIVSSIAADGGPATMIHALNVVGRVVEQRIDDNWRSRILMAYRFRMDA